MIFFMGVLVLRLGVEHMLRVVLHGDRIIAAIFGGMYWESRW